MNSTDVSKNKFDKNQIKQIRFDWLKNRTNSQSKLISLLSFGFSLLSLRHFKTIMADDRLATINENELGELLNNVDSGKTDENKMNCELMLTYDTPALWQTGSRNLTGQQTLPTIWGTYMKLVTKYQMSTINSC